MKKCWIFCTIFTKHAFSFTLYEKVNSTTYVTIWWKTLVFIYQQIEPSFVKIISVWSLWKNVTKSNVLFLIDYWLYLYFLVILFHIRSFFYSMINIRGFMSIVRPLPNKYVFYEWDREYITRKTQNKRQYFYIGTTFIKLAADRYFLTRKGNSNNWYCGDNKNHLSEVLEVKLWYNWISLRIFSY